MHLRVANFGWKGIALLAAIVAAVGAGALWVGVGGSAPPAYHAPSIGLGELPVDLDREDEAAANLPVPLDLLQDARRKCWITKSPDDCSWRDTLERQAARVGTD